jgi:hypothetical protein
MRHFWCAPPFKPATTSGDVWSSPRARSSTSPALTCLSSAHFYRREACAYGRSCSRTPSPWDFLCPRPFNQELMGRRYVSRVRTGLVLQLRIMAALVMRGSRCGLMSSSPERPADDEGFGERRLQQEAGEEVADFGDAGDEVGHGAQAAVDAVGLVSFGLPQAVRRNSAVSLARKASAARHKLIW